MTTGRAYDKDQTFLLMAEQLGHLGTCDRKHVGAIITYSGRCVSWGYNGAPPGAPHCEENHHGWAAELITTTECPRCHVIIGPKHPDPVVEFGCRNATHAELNALAFAARQGISTVNGTVYVTVSPCEVCARALIAAGITRVVYAEEYRDTRGIELLRSAGVEVG